MLIVCCSIIPYSKNEQTPILKGIKGLKSLFTAQISAVLKGIESLEQNQIFKPQYL